MVASASVDSSQRCSSLRASTRRMAMKSVSRPNSGADDDRTQQAQSAMGQPSVEMNHAPNTPPSMEMWPVVTDSTFDVENITL